MDNLAEAGLSRACGPQEREPEFEQATGSYVIYLLNSPPSPQPRTATISPPHTPPAILARWSSATPDPLPAEPLGLPSLLPVGSQEIHLARAFRAHKSGFRKLLSPPFNLYSTLAFSPEHSSPPNIYSTVLF